MTGEPEIFCIYARASNGAIGKNGQLPWHIPDDLKRFKALTMGAQSRGVPMIMGRKTFESFPSPLPGRRHIVLTRRERWDSTGAEVVRSVEEALARARQDNDTGQIAVVGGSAIYDVFLPLSRRVELTEVHAEFDGDTFMPQLGPEWEAVAREDRPADGGKPAFSWITLERAT